MWRRRHSASSPFLPPQFCSFLGEQSTRACASWPARPNAPDSCANSRRTRAGGTDGSQNSPVEGAGFGPSVPVRRAAVLSLPPSQPRRSLSSRRLWSRRRSRPDRAVEIADRRWCASEPPLESRIKPSRRVGPSRGDRWFESISLLQRVERTSKFGSLLDRSSRSPRCVPGNSLQSLRFGGLHRRQRAEPSRARAVARLFRTPEMARREPLLDQECGSPPSCNQLGLSVTTLGVFLRKHFIADVCSDGQTKGLIGPGWNDLV